METTESSTLFKFGNGERVKSKILRKIPSIIACKKIFIETYVVHCKILLLVRNDAMKKVGRRINFAIDIVRNTVTQYSEKSKIRCLHLWALLHTALKSYKE